MTLTVCVQCKFSQSAFSQSQSGSVRVSQSQSASQLVTQSQSELVRVSQSDSVWVSQSQVSQGQSESVRVSQSQSDPAGQSGQVSHFNEVKSRSRMCLINLIFGQG